MSLKIYLRTFLMTLALSVVTLSLSAQAKDVSGKVYDTDGKTPFVGVTITVKGATGGTVSDAKGQFKIKAKPADVLVFQYLGYENKEITVGTQTTINVTLQPKAEKIEEVVVTALGLTREQKSLGYAVSKIDNEALTNVVSSNWLNGMAGKVAGLNFDSASSGPGGSIRVTLRGEGSLSHDNNAALFVIDGVPIGSGMTGMGGSSYSDTNAPVDFGNGASDINPDDVESISVLKGPAATALYGSRAANGAIIITTKKGRTTKGVGVTFNSAVTFERAGFWPDFQDEYGAGNGNSAGMNNSNGDARRYYSFWTVDGSMSDNGQKYGRLQSRYGFGPRYEGQMFYQYDSYDWDNGTYTKLPWQAQDWYKGFFDTGITFTNSVSVDGSSGKGSSVRFSVKDSRMDWIVPNSGYTTQNFNVSLNQKINKKMSLAAKVTYYRKDSDNLPVTGYSQASPLYALLWNVPSVNIRSYYDEWANGRIPAMHKAGTGGSLINNGSGNARSDNVYWLANENLNTLDRDRIYGNMSVTYDILDNLHLMLRSGVDLNNDFTTKRKPQYSYGSNDGYYKEQQASRFEMNNDFLLSYDKKIKEFTVNASFGGNNMVYNYRNSFAEAKKLAKPNVFILQNSLNMPYYSAVRQDKSVNSLYGLISLSYQDTYFVDITGRNDWSSTLMPGNNSYFYPSVSASVLLDQVFKLGQKVNWINMLKVRGSWANVGNDTEPYRLDPVYSNGNFPSSYYLPTTKQNPYIKPENVESWEVGVEAKLFKNRWTLDVAYYQAKTTNQIIPVPVDLITGAGKHIINAGEVRNKGVEISTRVQPVKTKNVNWTINLNWSKNWNKLVSLAPSVDLWQLNTSTTIGDRVYIYAKPGTELGRIYGYGFERAPKGAFYTDANGNKIDCSDQVLVNPQTGNPILNTTDLKDLGSIFPDWKAGMTHSIQIKNFTVNMTFTGQWGGNCYSVTNFALGYQGKLKNSLPGRYTGLVHQGVNMTDGIYTPNTTITTDIVDYYNTSLLHRDNAEMNTFDTSFLKFKEMRLDYSLPQKICAKTKFIQGASIGVFATNLFCWTNFPQYDPEAASLNGSSISRGIESGAYPMTRTYGVNVKLTF